MLTLLLATTNRGKAAELAAQLAGVAELRTLADLPTLRVGATLRVEIQPPAETGVTFAENAAIKAEFWAAQTGLPCLADDSGILVDALPGELGVATRRWGAGENASDAAWLAHFLERMKDVPAERRGAAFVCVLALARPSMPTLFFEGNVRGTLTTAAEAPLISGIPLSSVFRPEGATQVFAALTPAEKARCSHRGHAGEKLRAFLTGQ